VHADGPAIRSSLLAAATEDERDAPCMYGGLDWQLWVDVRQAVCSLTASPPTATPTGGGGGVGGGLTCAAIYRDAR